jgi:hypothetical protein
MSWPKKEKKFIHSEGQEITSIIEKCDKDHEITA